MSSITVRELITCLEQYPDNYEVIMSWYWKEKENGETKQKHSIAMINGVDSDDDYKEVRLLN